MNENSQKTILLVDDENLIRDFAAKVLRIHGYEVLTAENGESAVELCRDGETTLDLLLTDYSMPSMNGQQLYSRLQEIYPHMPVLYMSGYQEDVLEESGTNDETPFIHKPFTIEKLATKVRELLRISESSGAMEQ